MLNNMDETIQKLCLLGLSADEAKIYLELSKKPNTQLGVSRFTGVERSKVYRVVERLESRGLVARQTDDAGTLLASVDPSSLEVGLIAQERELQDRHKALEELKTELAALRKLQKPKFTVRSFAGVAGLKEMAWHELKTKSNLLSLGKGTIEEQVADRRWAQEHRYRQIDAGYKALEITNHTYSKDDNAASFASQIIIDACLYEHRHIPSSKVCFDGQTIIYNNTVAIYRWEERKRVGLEIISEGYADMMRQIFQLYWGLSAT